MDGQIDGWIDEWVNRLQRQADAAEALTCPGAVDLVTAVLAVHDAVAH